MSYSDFERARRADRRAIIQQARHALDDLNVYLINARLERHRYQRAPMRIVRKVRENALIVRPRLKYHITDNSRYR